MARIKDIPQVDRPRERFLKKGAEALSKSDLLAILLGTGIEGKNVKQLAEHIVKRFGKSLLDTKVDDLLEIQGIGQAKALQIVSAISLVKRCYKEQKGNEVLIRNLQDVLPLVYDLREKKKEYLVCLYLDARNVLIKKETISIGLLDKSLVHPREVFYPAIETNAASIILVHNHPSGIVVPSKKDIEVVKKIAQAGEIMGISITDFIIIADNGTYSFYNKLGHKDRDIDYVAEEVQGTLFDLLKIERPAYEIDAERMKETRAFVPQIKSNRFQLQNRRYIGNKYRLIDWIFSIVDKECKDSNSFTDIFAGTGIVAAVATRHFEKIILNDLLYSNYAIYQAFFGNGEWDKSKTENIIRDYNNIDGDSLEDNYFSEYFGGKYFSHKSAKIIGFIRESIEGNREFLTAREYYILIASLLYSIDKIANTVGHYDAYFKKDHIEDGFFMKLIDPINSGDVEIFREDANLLARRIETDIVYVDPPYNSRQYSRFYHVLETLTKWDKPKLYGTALKPNSENMSDYCRIQAGHKLSQLVNDIKAKYIVVSYNNTYDSKSNSSRNKITLQEIRDILSRKGKTKVFEKDYRHFNAGNTEFKNHKEYLFVTTVKND